MYLLSHVQKVYLEWRTLNLYHMIEFSHSVLAIYCLLYRFDDKEIHARYILANFLARILPNLHVIIQF